MRRALYRPFSTTRAIPATICASRNDVIVHGIPNDEALEDGDIVGIDCGVIYQGYFGDAARTFASRRGQTRRAPPARRDAAVTAIWLSNRSGRRRLSDIGHAVQQHVEEHGFSVVREFVGHGIGTRCTRIRRCRTSATGSRTAAQVRLVLAIEPMVNAGSPGVRVDRDGWTARTDDGSLSAHFEFSVALTDSGPRVLGCLRMEAATA